MQNLTDQGLHTLEQQIAKLMQGVSTLALRHLVSRFGWIPKNAQKVFHHVTCDVSEYIASNVVTVAVVCFAITKQYPATV